MSTEFFAVILLGMIVTGVITAKLIMDGIHDIMTGINTINEHTKVSIGEICLTVATEVANIQNLHIRICRIVEDRLFSEESGHNVSDQVKYINVLLNKIHRANAVLAKHGGSITMRSGMYSDDFDVPFSEYEKSALPGLYLFALTEMIELTDGGTRELTMLDYSTIIARCRVRLEEREYSTDDDQRHDSSDRVKEP